MGARSTIPRKRDHGPPLVSIEVLSLVPRWRVQTVDTEFAKQIDQPGSPDVPEAQRLRTALISRVAADLHAQGVTRIALFGAGRHTRPIVREPWSRYGISVALIFDDDEAVQMLGGIPVVQPERSRLAGIDAVIISSWSYEGTLAQRAQHTLGDAGVPIVRIYNDSDERFKADATVETLVEKCMLSREDAEWLTENRGERHDALLPMLPPARTELHIRRYELALEIAQRTRAQTVLDAACGTGYGSVLLTSLGSISYTGVDIDARAVEYASKRYGNSSVHYRCGSALDLDVSSGSQDIIASFETIEHIEDTKTLLQAYARVLSDRGLLIISTPNKLGPTPYHVHDFDRESFMEALSDEFDVIRMYGQLPVDEVSTPDLPPGMWVSQASDDDMPADNRIGSRPDFLIAVACKKRSGMQIQLPGQAVSTRSVQPHSSDETVVHTKHGPITFFTPNATCMWRARTLLEKEPETLEWIDRFDPGDTFWDIGASTGPYTMYAHAAGKVSSVVAFEPSAWNLWVLNEQIRRAGAQERVCALPLALHDGSFADRLCMQHPSPGGAGSSFLDPVLESGERFDPSFNQGAIGVSVDTLVQSFGLKIPNRIKIDVDGNEERIIRGAFSTLHDPRVKSIVVELDSSREDLISRVTESLLRCGLNQIAKRHALSVDSTENASIYNYEFTRAEM